MFLHYDMDCFFASIEMRDRPELKSKALVVGDHVIATCNYIARKYGIHSAMTVSMAKKRFPKILVITPRKEYYLSISKKIQEVICKKFKKVKFLSCDEGYIQIDIDKKNIYEFSLKFQKLIEDKFNLPVSIGVGYNRLAAKIASEVNKPNGIYAITSKEEFIDYVYDKNVKIFPGIGEKAREVLYNLNVSYTKELYAISKEDLRKALGKARADMIYMMIRGNSDEYFDIEKIEKSISKERTFYPALKNFNEIYRELESLVVEIRSEILSKNIYPLTLVLKIRNDEFETITKSKTFFSPINENSDILLLAKELLINIYKGENIRLLGLLISNFTKCNYEYLKLFGD